MEKFPLMQLRAIFENGHLHHAYLLEGEAAVLAPTLRGLVESELGISAAGNPDFWHGRFESLAVADARDLRERQGNKAFGGDKKIFIIETASATPEAQNALLKILEEPSAGTHFFLIMPSRWLLLPTVRSRLQVISLSGEAASGDNRAAREFLKASPAERFKIIAPALEEKDKAAAIVFIDGLIGFFHGKIEAPGHSAVLKDLIRLRSYLNDRSASLKLILEHLALTLPPLQ